MLKCFNGKTILTAFIVTSMAVMLPTILAL